MVWTCAEIGLRVHWTKDVEYGVARQEEKRKTMGKVLGCSEGHTEEDAKDRVRWRQISEKRR